MIPTGQKPDISPFWLELLDLESEDVNREDTDVLLVRHRVHARV